MKSKMYVRFLLLVLACGYGPLGAAMAQTQVVRLLCAGGECAGLTFNLSGEGSVYVDWGDGNVVDYHGDIITGKCHEDTITVTLPETITGFDCAGLCISWLDVIGAPNLISLNCADNQLEELSVDSLKGLAELDCSGNGLSELKVDSNAALRYLDCADNRLTRLDVSRCGKLEVLCCSDNGMESVGLAPGGELKSLWGSGNGLTALDLTGYPGLNSVVVSDCGLRWLALENATKLQDLWAERNDLTTLNLKGADQIFSANVSDNRLEAIGMEGFTTKTLTYLFDCSGNRLPFSSFYSVAKVKNYVCGLQAPVYCGLDSVEIETMMDLSAFVTNAARAKVGAMVIKDAKTHEELVKGSSDKDYQYLSGRLRFWHAVDSAYMVVTSSKYPDLEIRSNRFVVYDPKVGVHSAVLQENLQVTAGRGALVLRAPVEEEASVVAADGRVFWQGAVPAGKAVSVALPQGIYLVNGHKYKVK